MNIKSCHGRLVLWWSEKVTLEEEGSNNNNNTFTWSSPSGVLRCTGQRPVGRVPGAGYMTFLPKEYRPSKSGTEKSEELMEVQPPRFLVPIEHQRFTAHRMTWLIKAGFV
jgi:hypothetical protein